MARRIRLKEKYLDGFNAWNIIPEVNKLAVSISPEDKRFNKLHAAQLIKHILGLLHHYESRKDKFRLLYLYYAVPGQEGYIHDIEIAEFSEIGKKDGVCFQTITWQELICNLFRNCYENHKPYIQYLFERYV